jgi:hypothetical protein
MSLLQKSNPERTGDSLPLRPRLSIESGGIITTPVHRELLSLEGLEPLNSGLKEKSALSGAFVLNCVEFAAQTQKLKDGVHRLLVSSLSQTCSKPPPSLNSGVKSHARITYQCDNSDIQIRQVMVLLPNLFCPIYF